MRNDEPRHVWTTGPVCPSRTSEREGKGYCVRGGWREEGELVKELVGRSVDPIPNPDPNPKHAPQMSLKEASLNKCALIGKPVCGGGVCVGGGGRAFYYTYIDSGKR